MHDKIKHPKHYTQGIECWDYITSHKMGYLEGNIIKYVTRYKDKDGLDDLFKAKAYLQRLIEEQFGPSIVEESPLVTENLPGKLSAPCELDGNAWTASWEKAPLDTESYCLGDWHRSADWMKRPCLGEE